MTALPESYDTAAIEKKWQQHWLAAKTYAWDANAARVDSYVIDTPPPTVSGVLHMGHVFSYTQADFVARYQRMTGKNVFYPMGFDDNGLPTERLVEKSIKKRATDMSREEFIAECLKVSEEARKEFRTFFDSIALSVDWAQEYHTISDSSRRLSQLSFLDLVQKGHVYRELKPFYWDPVDQTAIAQAEIVDKELPSHFTDIAFTCAHTKEELVIGTTRPELLPACVALFYHPDDARYKKHKGHKAIVPLFGYEVPILEDDTVEMDKGTGLMMCCTFGDDKDIAKWQKYKLPTRVILNKYAKIDFGPLTVELPATLVEKLRNKKASNTDPKNLGARELILEELKSAGLIRKQDSITHAVKTAERSGAVLELLPTYQWFVRLLDKKEALKKKSKDCNWHPEWMQVRMEQWIEGLNQDWCISRQRYFGVPFPVWYVTPYLMANGDRPASHDRRNIYALPAQLPVNPLTAIPPGFTKIGSAAEEPAFKKQPDVWSSDLIKDSTGNIFSCIPDLDVMDTWATSSISPQLSAHALGPHPNPLPEGEGIKHTSPTGRGRRTEGEPGEGDGRFDKLYPADLRPQAHEIIRTWAFYTLVKSHLHSDLKPWENLMISGWCLAEDKTKMSKSKGNVITPVALIEEKGTDAVRYWAGTSRLGQDAAFSQDLLKIGKKLVTKLWNATQFAAIHLDKMTDAPTTAVTDNFITEAFDKWIIARLGQAVAEANQSFQDYEYAVALEVTNQFFWADFCDNYLELIKKRVYNEDDSFTAAQQQSAVRALYYCLNTILKLYAPFIPHVAEELYSHIFADEYAAKKSIHSRGQWPNYADYPGEIATINVLCSEAVLVLDEIRKRKADNKVSIKTAIRSLHMSYAENWEQYNQVHKSIFEDIRGAGNIEELQVNYSLASGASSQITKFNLADSADAA